MRRGSRNILAFVAALMTAGTVAAIWYWMTRPDYPVLCQKAANDRNWLHVEELATEWLSANPNETLAWYWLAQAHFVKGEFATAAAAYQHVPVDGPRGIEAATALMQILFHQQQKPVEAMVYADQLLEQDPKLTEPRRTRIYYEAMTLQRGPLLEDIQEAIETRADLPEHYIYLMTLEELSFRDGPAVTGRWSAASPEDSNLNAACLVQIALNARAEFLTNATDENQQNVKRVTEELWKLYDSGNRQPALIETLIQLAMEEGELKKSENLLNNLPEAATNDPVLWLWIGRYALQTNEWEEAERALKKSIQLNPLGWKARNEYAQLLRQTNRQDEAASMQKIASQGMELTGEIRRLDHVRNAPRKLMEQIAEFAVSCEKWNVANGIYRRYPPGAR